MNRIRSVLNLSTWFAFAVFVLTLIWAGFVDQPYLSYSNLPFPVLTPKVRVGDPVMMTVIRCNSDKVDRVYILGRTLVPVNKGPAYVMPAGATAISPGCHTSISAINVIPAGVEPGMYYIEGRAEVSGELRSFNLGWRSQPFEVIP